MKETGGFSFWHSYYEAGRNLPDEERLKFYDAVISYGITGEEPEAEGVARALFELARPNIEKSKMRREIGKSGGAKKAENLAKADQTPAKSLPNAYQNSTKTLPKLYQTPTDREREREREGEREEKKSAQRMKRPTVEEVRAYCEERKNRVDAQIFVDFYEAKGWKVGRDPMKDWKACVRTWEKREKEKAATPFHSFEQRSSIDWDSIVAN